MQLETLTIKPPQPAIIAAASRPHVLQQRIAGSAALIFFVVTAWVAFETKENVLTLKASMQKAAIDFENAHKDMILEYERKAKDLENEGVTRRDAIRAHSQSTVEKAEFSRDSKLRAIDEDLATEQQNARSKYEADRGTKIDSAKKVLNEKSSENDSRVAVLNKALANLEGKLGTITVELNRNRAKLGNELLLKQSNEQNRSVEKRKLRELEREAKEAGFEFVNGRAVPKTWAAYVKQLWSDLENRWHDSSALIDELNNALKSVQASIEKLNDSISACEVEAVTWAQKLSAQRNLVTETKARLDQERAAVEERLNDELKDWTAGARAQLSTQLEAKAALADAKRGDARQSTQAQIQSARNQELEQEKAESGLEVALREKLHDEREKALLRLESAYEHQFKPWEKDRRLRSLVGLLHVLTGLYAFVLAARAWIRWLQFRGRCSQPSLVPLS